jgi:osmotically inducible protein OsmC
MAERIAKAQWNGGLKDGSGKIKLISGAFEGSYSFSSRFEEGPGTNPEELIAGAHAGCFSMALSADLEKAGYKPNSVNTTAKVTLGKVDGKSRITKIELTTETNVPGIQNEEFQKIAEGAKNGCPVSVALAGVDISLKAKLVQ